MHEDTKSYYPPPERPEDAGRDPFALILATLTAVLAIIAIVLAVVALTRDDKTAAVPGDFRVSAENIEDESVTERALAPAAVSTDKIADGVVTAAKLAEDAVPEVAIAPGSVDTEALADDAVRRAKIRDGAVASSELANGAVTGPKLADDAVTGAKVADDSLSGEDIDEETLDVVPAAETATVAETAMAVEGFDPSALGVSFEVATASSTREAGSTRGPVEAACPAGSRAVGGGAEIVSDLPVPVALTRSTLNSETSWAAVAQAWAESDEPWELQVTVVCAATSP